MAGVFNHSEGRGQSWDVKSARRRDERENETMNVV